LVRHQIVSGTHALAVCLYGHLRPKDELLAITGKPYDTLEEVIGLRGEGGHVWIVPLQFLDKIYPLDMQ